MPSAYLKRRLRSLDEALGERGLSRIDVGLSPAPAPTNENEPPPPVIEGVPFRTLVLACCACLILGMAIGAGVTATVQRSGEVGSSTSAR